MLIHVSKIDRKKKKDDTDKCSTTLTAEDIYIRKERVTLFFSFRQITYIYTFVAIPLQTLHRFLYIRLHFRNHFK